MFWCIELPIANHCMSCSYRFQCEIAELSLFYWYAGGYCSFAGFPSYLTCSTTLFGFSVRGIILQIIKGTPWREQHYFPPIITLVIAVMLETMPIRSLLSWLRRLPVLVRGCWHMLAEDGDFYSHETYGRFPSWTHCPCTRLGCGLACERTIPITGLIWIIAEWGPNSSCINASKPSTRKPDFLQLLSASSWR
mmetsp:Transcript_88193/g.175145  ORF Transcript_88193/g.175145 Transcript_88193/m.175145 type:complete len:193 (+) Transcript_88193:1108-1686(+)